MKTTDDLLLLLVSQTDHTLIIPDRIEEGVELSNTIERALADELILMTGYRATSGNCNRLHIIWKGWERLSVLLKVTVHLTDGTVIEYKGEL